MQTAEAEASFDCKRFPSTSSARGCFGITSGTWKGAARNWGDKYGFTERTDRTDPYWGALVAGLLIKYEAIPSIRGSLSANEEISPAHIYAFHFFGGPDNGKFTAALETRPDTRARDLLPRAASANPTIFRSRSIREVFSVLASKVRSITSFEERPPEMRFVVTDKPPTQQEPGILDTIKKGWTDYVTKPLGF